MKNKNGYYYWFDIKAPASLVEDVKLIVENKIKKVEPGEFNTFVMDRFIGTFRSTDQIKNFDGYYLEDDVAVTVCGGEGYDHIVMSVFIMAADKVTRMADEVSSDTTGFKIKYTINVTGARFFQEFDMDSMKNFAVEIAKEHPIEDIMKHVSQAWNS